MTLQMYISKGQTKAYFFFKPTILPRNEQTNYFQLSNSATMIELFRSFFGRIRGQQKVLLKLTDLQYSNRGGKQGSRNSTVSKQSIISCGCIVVWGKLVMEFKKDKGRNFWEIIYSTQWFSLLMEVGRELFSSYS